MRAVQQFFDVLLAPIEGLAVRPGGSTAWVWIVLFVVVVGSAAPLVTFLYSNKGREAIGREQVARYDQVRSRFTPTQFQRFMTRAEEYRNQMWYSYGLRRVVSTTLFILFVSWVLFYVLPPFTGVTIPYIRVLGIVAIASVIFIVEGVYVAVYDYVSGSVAFDGDLHTLVPVGVPGWLGPINPLTIWWLGVVSIGLSIVHRTRSLNFAVPMWLCHVVLAIVSSLAPTISSSGLPNFH